MSEILFVSGWMNRIHKFADFNRPGAFRLNCLDGKTLSAYNVLREYKIPGQNILLMSSQSKMVDKIIVNIIITEGRSALNSLKKSLP